MGNAGREPTAGEIITKICALCGVTRPITDFWTSKCRKDGLYPWCKACCTKKARQYYQAHKAQRKAEANEYYYKNHVKCRSQQAEYYRTHKADSKQRDSKYYQDNREAILAKVTEYRNTHKAEIAARDARYAQEHPDVKRAARRRWEKRNPEQLTIYKRIKEQRRRARKMGLPHSLTDTEWEAICAAFDYRCAYCGARSRNLAQEHIVPVVNGGGYTADNVIPACKRCNSRKGTQSLESFVLNAERRNIIFKQLANAQNMASHVT